MLPCVRERLLVEWEHVPRPCEPAMLGVRWLKCECWWWLRWSGVHRGNPTGSLREITHDVSGCGRRLSRLPSIDSNRYLNVRYVLIIRLPVMNVISLRRIVWALAFSLIRHHAGGESFDVAIDGALLR